MDVKLFKCLFLESCAVIYECEFPVRGEPIWFRIKGKIKVFPEQNTEKKLSDVTLCGPQEEPNLALSDYQGASENSQPSLYLTCLSRYA